jgi:pyridoxal biosynthesis lyase PdxS
MRSTSWMLAILTAAGCASAAPPLAEVASATAAVRGAEEGGALRVPEAALHVKLAEEQVNRARQLMEDEQNERARSIAVRAYQDAELALALARVAQADRQLQAFLTKHPGAASTDSTQGAETPNGENPNGAATSQPEPTTVQ